MVYKTLGIILISILFSCSTEPIAETIIEGTAIDFYSNQPITTGYVKLYDSFNDPASPQLHTAEFVVIDSFSLDSNGYFYYKTNKLETYHKYKIDIKRDSMISIDTNYIKIGMENQLVLKTKKFQKINIRIEYSSNDYSQILLKINERFIDAVNGIPYSEDHVIPYGYCFFWNQKIDTSFSVSVIPGFPYEIEFNSRLNGTTYYHFEETIQLAENEEKTIELDDKNAL